MPEVKTSDGGVFRAMYRAITFFLIVFFVLNSPSASLAKRSGKIDTRSGKYAALVMDADTGEVLFSRSADAKRYPASLTKMMTLYKLFDALSKGHVDMSTRMRVSAKAAAQPQTNISLKEGQTIRVSDAIRALVVRSANDVAVVIAEALGNTTNNFAVQMTKTARQLGMRRTVFRNPHGLPDKNQYTTARDMAKLGIALRRDFPQYYNFFKTTQFRWKGKTYKSHNKILRRFNGVDGIKTGYIRMSGFNLVSSVKRDGYQVVAVVMGGQTSKTRDNHMLSLLNRTFTVLAERGDRPRNFASAPVPVAKPEIESETTPVSAKLVKLTRESGQLVDAEEVSFMVGNARITPQGKPIEVVASLSSEHVLRAPKSKHVLKLPANARPSPKPAINVNSKEAPLAGEWGIQVGAFQDERSALFAAANAVKLARDTLRNSKVFVTDQGNIEASIHRARLANLSEYQAKRACRQLVENNAQCFVFRTAQMAGL